MPATVLTWYCSVPVPEKFSTTFSIPGKPCLRPLTVSMFLLSVKGHAAVSTLSCRSIRKELTVVGQHSKVCLQL